MWSYYGSKTSMVDLYPPPMHDKIVEPFAGTAKYSLKYFEKDVLLCDKYKVIIDIWKWLQKCSKNDVLSLPRPKTGESLNDYRFDCEEAKLFMGFIIGAGSQSPRLTVSAFCEKLRPNRINKRLKEVSENLFKIKHWDIRHGDYMDLQNEKATWYIDPPYQHGGYVYVENKIDFKFLASWCKSRKGQIIVCENSKADWMDFKPMKTFKGTTRKTVEAIWSNMPTNYDNIQQELFI